MVENAQTVTIRIRKKRIQGKSQEKQSFWDSKEWQRGSHSSMKGPLCEQRQPARSAACSEDCVDSSLFGVTVCDWENMGPPARRGPWK